MARISERVIGCAIAVSNQLGTGFLEAVYANAFAIELKDAGISFEREKELTVLYKQQRVGLYFADFVIEDRLAVELKALSSLTAEHAAQVMNYLRASGLQVGLLLNFGTSKLGIQRVVLDYNEDASI